MQNLKGKLSRMIATNEERIKHINEDVKVLLEDIDRGIRYNVKHEHIVNTCNWLPIKLFKLRYKLDQLKVLTEENDSLKELLHD